MRKIRLVLIVILVFLVYPTIPYRTSAQVVVPIGVLISDNSDSTSIIDMVDFIERDMNDYMSVNGYDYVFDYICRDTEGDAVTALNNVELFKEQGINLIVELGDASQGQAVLSYIDNNDMVLISSASSDISLSVFNDRLFRVSINDRAQAMVLAELWSSWGVETLVIMHRGDSWGDGFKKEFSETLDDLGIEVLGYVRYDPNNPDVSSYVSYANNIVLGSLGAHSISEIGLQLFSRSEVIAIQNLASQYPFLQSTIWMSTGDGGKSQVILDEVGGSASQTRHFSPVLALDVHHPYWSDFSAQYSENNGEYPDWNQALMYDALSLLSNCVADTGSFSASVIADALVPYSSTYTGLTGSLKLDVNGDRLPLLLDVWGYYEDPISGEPSYRSWGTYDGQKNEVYWDDIDLINHAELIRPAYIENPLSSYISCSISSPALYIWSSQTVSSLLEPPLARTTVNFVFAKPDGSTVSRVAVTDENGFCFETLTLEQAGVWAVYAFWAGDGVHAETRSPSLTFNVDKRSSLSECTPYDNSVPIGERIYVNGSISPLIENTPVIITITRPDGAVNQHIVVTDENGVATASVIADQIGTWSFHVLWEGDDERYGSASAVKEVAVTKYTSDISIESSSLRVDPGSRIMISGYLDPTWADVPLLLTFVYPNGTIEDVSVLTTFLGRYSINITPLEPGMYTVKVSWEGDDSYNGTESVVKEITVKKMSSKLVIDASATVISAGNSVTIFGYLEPSLSDALIEINFVKPDGSVNEVDISTNSAGKFSLEYTLDEPRYYFVKANWQGDARFNGSSSRTLELEVIDFQNMKIIVKDAEGIIIESASVTSTTQPSGQQTLTGLTNQEGYVFFEKVAAGSYSFLVTIEGYESNIGSLVVSPGDTSETTLLLEELQPESKGIPGFPTLSMLLALSLVIIVLSRKM